MDPDSPLTAADIVNTYDEAALADVLRRYGEERFARRIAAYIVRRRAVTPFTRTGELVDLLYQAIPAPARRTGGHPAKRTFQALRIAVNDELESLRRALPTALDALTVEGRIVVLAYQSLEDRIVKDVFRHAVTPRTPAGLPIELPGHAPEFKSLTRGAERADRNETERNPRSARSGCGPCSECGRRSRQGDVIDAGAPESWSGRPRRATSCSTCRQSVGTHSRAPGAAVWATNHAHVAAR
ncbi:ribosomal RNA small subunut methyltransferase H [Mycobacterium xenopi 4042]|uniref:Ribosomal RNA small subunut methyltransferase H n=1 Tax=Mycobacterium xenopi 4042 TaxID=1299334 RepID=X7ZWI6_MYCXE|nr:ribosomal RNA small subunut methyltransferase H [Mycobacterium xenopi 4042]